MIASVYARKSTLQEGANGTSESVERQIEHAKAYIARKGFALGTVFYDDNVSGATYARLDGRKRLVAAAEAEAFQVLVVSEQSRLGRDMIEVAYTIKQIAECGVRIVAYLDGSEIGIEGEQAIMTMLRGYKDQGARSDTSRRVYDAALRRVRAGQVAGAKVFGYDNVTVLGPSGKKAHVERRKNEAQAATVVRVFEMYAAGLGSVTIARTLNAEGVDSPRPRGVEPDDSARCAAQSHLRQSGDLGSHQDHRASGEGLQLAPAGVGVAAPRGPRAADRAGRALARSPSPAGDEPPRDPTEPADRPPTRQGHVARRLQLRPRHRIRPVRVLRRGEHPADASPVRAGPPALYRPGLRLRPPRQPGRGQVQQRRHAGARDHGPGRPGGDRIGPPPGRRGGGRRPGPRNDPGRTGLHRRAMRSA